MNDKLEGIIRKIKGLMAVANGHANEEEAQSAFVMAQKLMMKYNIELSEINGNDEASSVTNGQGSSYKTLRWEEKMLAKIISENFRVKYYFNNRHVEGSTKRKKCIMFFGLEQDVQIAKEIFVLANEALEHYTKAYLKHKYAIMVGKARSRELTKQLKDSYMLGFLNGLSDKLSKQRFELQQEFGLVVLMPQVVHDEYDKFSEGFTKGKPTRIPSVSEQKAYSKGYETGEKIDYTKSTLDD